MTKILKSFFFDKEQLARLKKLSSKTIIPQSVYMKEALDLVLNKYERNLRAGFKRERPSQVGTLKGLNKETFKRLYITEQKSLHEIARIFKCSTTAVIYRCKRYGIKLRPRMKEIKGLNKSTLQRLYVKEGTSINKIAKMFSCSFIIIQNRCKKYGIELRKPKELNRPLLQKLYIEEGKTIRKIAEILGCSREGVRIRCKQFGIELRPRNRKFEIDESTLHRLYIKEGKTLTEVAAIFGCAVSTISKRAKRLGLKKRTGRKE